MREDRESKIDSRDCTWDLTLSNLAMHCQETSPMSPFLDYEPIVCIVSMYESLGLRRPLGCILPGVHKVATCMQVHCI